MKRFVGKTALVTGASRGLGRAIAELLAQEGAKVVAVARNRQLLDSLKDEATGEVIAELGDVSEADVPGRLLKRYQPDLLVLAAGATPHMAPVHQQSWEQFTAVWNNDVKQTFHFGVAAIEHLKPGSRVLILSSGAALGGSPWSGGYAGAKRMQLFLADYLAGVSKQANKQITFQSLVPKQMIGETQLGHSASSGYAKILGITKEKFLERFGKPLTPQLLASRVGDMLSAQTMTESTNVAITGEGLASLD